MLKEEVSTQLSSNTFFDFAVTKDLEKNFNCVQHPISDSEQYALFIVI